MKNSFKKLLALSLSLMLLAGCAGNAPAASTPSAAGSAPAAPTNRLEQIKATGKLVMATSPDFAPYEFEDIRKSGQEAIVGADIELGKYIAKGLGVELVIEPMDFGAVVAAVTEGKVDIGISGMAPKPERAAAMELSVPYNKGSGYQGVMIAAKNKDVYKSLADLKGKKIGAQNGSLQFDLSSSQVESPQIELITSLNDGIMMLQTGKIDALAMSSTTGDQYAANYPELVMSEIKFDYESAGNIAGIKKGEVELLEEVNKLIKEAESTGLYQKWVEEATALAKELNVK